MRKKIDSYTRCPWCWNFMINFAINKAADELWIDREKIVFVSWIWCSGKMAHFVNGYAAETLHGRVLPFATGLKLARPDLTVIWYSWDWDAYWIWMWHFVHSCDKDLDITYIVTDNQNYALTTWQASPTTPLSSPIKHDNYVPVNPIKIAEASWCKFNHQTTDKDINWLTELIKKAIAHKWFSHIQVDQSCPSWRNW